jgi:CheY-like chemotaxis protein
VDDNEDAANMLVSAFQASGHEAMAVYDGESALTAVGSFDPAAVVMDLGLPMIDGFELARRLRARPETASLRLVALTGYGQSRDASEAKACGFDAHLIKPATFEDVLAALGAVHN